MKSRKKREKALSWVRSVTLSYLSLLLLKPLCWNRCVEILYSFIMKYSEICYHNMFHCTIITGGKMIYIFDSVIPTGDTASVILLCGLSDKMILFYTTRAGRWSVTHPSTLNVVLSFVCLCISMRVCMRLSVELSAVSQEDPEEKKKHLLSLKSGASV